MEIKFQTVQKAPDFERVKPGIYYSGVALKKALGDIYSVHFDLGHGFLRKSEEDYLPLLFTIFKELHYMDGKYYVVLREDNINESAAVAFPAKYNPHDSLGSIFDEFLNGFGYIYCNKWGRVLHEENNVTFSLDNVYYMKFKAFGGSYANFYFYEEALMAEADEGIEEIYDNLSCEEGIVYCSIDEFETKEDFVRYVIGCEKYIKDYFVGEVYDVWTKDGLQIMCDSEISDYVGDFGCALYSF